MPTASRTQYSRSCPSASRRSKYSGQHTCVAWDGGGIGMGPWRRHGFDLGFDHAALTRKASADSPCMSVARWNG